LMLKNEFRAWTKQLADLNAALAAHA
jgi:hypothetical protein